MEFIEKEKKRVRDGEGARRIKEETRGPITDPNLISIANMVLISVGNSEIGAHVRSDLGYLFWYVFRSR